ncbi:phage tail tube protein [Natrinema zhouii]|uniref:Uncharacterized protein n=1 Tax=Natrinema zhouii TaxID=1710539 RepID=A0A7D6CQC3_9EURY|nr:phage tail tube protein [Natrinema zhouii]QLK25411.1 phage tail tube protein [Natrinema zhouii]
MTGAGTTNVAWTREPSFAGDPSTPTYVYPGRNVSVTDLTIERALERSRLPDDNEAVESIATALEGALAVEYDLCHPWMLTDAFVSDDTDSDSDGVLEWSMGRGQMPSSRWYIGVDVGASVCERELKGAATTQLQIQISQNAPARVTQTIVYADEDENTSLTPGDVVGGDESPYMFHGADLTIDSSTKKKLQSGTLTITNGGSLDTGWNQVAIDAVAGDANYSLSVSKIADDSISENLSLAYGSSGATSPGDSVDGVSGEIPIIRADGDQITFPLTGVRPNSLSWDNIPPGDEERVQELFEFYVDRVEATADVTMSDPF